MISLKQIMLSINNKLLDQFPGVPIQSSDIEEGFERPSFFVELETTTAAYGSRSRERRVPVVIYYFPKDRYQNQIELLEVQEQLETVFQGTLFITDGFAVSPSELSGLVIDGVLQLSFDIYYIETYATESGPDIEELSLNIEKRD